MLWACVLLPQLALDAVLRRLPDPDAPLAQRHLWLIDAMRWVRGDEKDVQASVSRVREFLDSVQADPELQQRWRRWWQRFGDAPMTALIDQALAANPSVLNAQAVRSLDSTSRTLQQDVSKLIAGMEQSIREADAFIKGLVLGAL